MANRTILTALSGSIHRESIFTKVMFDGVLFNAEHNISALKFLLQILDDDFFEISLAQCSLRFSSAFLNLAVLPQKYTL